MKISDIMNPRVESISPEESIKDAAIKMRDLNIGLLPVIENERLIGIITDRDICCKVTAIGRDSVFTKVKTVMNKEIVTCIDDQEITSAAHLMQDWQVRRLAVFDRENRISGLLSVDDLAKASHDLASDVLEATVTH